MSSNFIVFNIPNFFFPLTFGLFLRNVDSLSKNQFLNDNLHHNYGIVRDYDTSSRVMDSWKRWFKDVDQINFDLLLMEDDVVVLINFMDFKKKLI